MIFFLTKKQLKFPQHAENRSHLLVLIHQTKLSCKCWLSFRELHRRSLQKDTGQVQGAGYWMWKGQLDSKELSSRLIQGFICLMSVWQALILVGKRRRRSMSSRSEVTALKCCTKDAFAQEGSTMVDLVGNLGTNWVTWWQLYDVERPDDSSNIPEDVTRNKQCFHTGK